MNVMAAGCLLLDVCNEAVLNKADFMLCDMRGGGLLCVTSGNKQERCMAHLGYDVSAVTVITLALCHCHSSGIEEEEICEKV